MSIMCTMLRPAVGDDRPATTPSGPPGTVVVGRLVVMSLPVSDDAGKRFSQGAQVDRRAWHAPGRQRTTPARLLARQAGVQGTTQVRGARFDQFDGADVSRSAAVPARSHQRRARRKSSHSRRGTARTTPSIPPHHVGVVCEYRRVRESKATGSKHTSHGGSTGSAVRLETSGA
jgi:hypothetical protein